jgi:hypothetical protein
LEGRDFTQTEHRIIQRILNIVFEAYSKSWEPIYPIEFEFIRSEMNTQFANIATPNEVVVAVTIAIELGQSAAKCILHALFDDRTDQGSADQQPAGRKPGSGQALDPPDAAADPAG